MATFKILLVEDDPNWSEILYDHLHKALQELAPAGHSGEIVIVRTFEEGWKRLASAETWNLLSTDIALRDKGTDGAQLVIKAGQRGIPTLIVSGTKRVTSQEACDYLQRYHARWFFTKQDLQPAEYIAQVKRLLKEVDTKGQSDAAIFISYCRRDTEFLDRFKVYAQPLKERGVLDIWDDTKIQAGDYWQVEIERALARATAAILFVSADFSASRFMTHFELPKLLEAAEKRGLRLLPILISPVHIGNDHPLAKIQFLNSLKKPLRGMTGLEQEEFWMNLVSKLEQIQGQVLQSGIPRLGK